VYWQAVLSGCLLVWWSGLAYAETAPCQESLMRFLSQMYLTGSYCTCATMHREVVIEQGRIRRHVQFTLPGLSLRQRGPLPDLSRVQARFWGMIVSGPGGEYALSVRLYEAERNVMTLDRHLKHIRQGQEFEITTGPQHRILLQARTPYRIMVESSNALLRPQQQLALQGRACFYLVAD
jgi:hypothetical protein